MDGGQVETVAINAGGGRFVRPRPARPERQDPGVPRCASRPASTGWPASILAPLRGAARELRRPEPVAAADPPAAELQAPREPHPRRSRRSRKRFEARREESAGQRGAGPPVRRGRPVRGGPGGPRGRASRASTSAATGPAGKHRPGCARTIVTHLARRAYRRPVTARDVDPLARLPRPRAGGRVVRRGARPGPPGDARLARFPLPHRARPDSAARPGRRRSADRSLRAGLAPLVLPLGQHARRGAAALRRSAARCASRPCWPPRCGAC